MLSVVDTYFIGMLGTEELAAISFTFPIILIINNIALGLGTGASALISRAIGESDTNKVKRLTTDSLTLALLLVSVFVVIGFSTIEPLFSLMGADPKLIHLIDDYMSVWYSGVLFVVVPMVGNHAIRSTGDMKIPSVIMIVSVLTNAILDPIFIFGLGPIPAMHLSGAALATVIARATSLTASLYFLVYRYKMITCKIPSLSVLLSSWKEILHIGLPVAGTNVITPLAMSVMTRLVAMYGAAAVAALGVSIRIETFVFIVIVSLYTVINPFIGQNLGAGNFKRIKKALKYIYRFSFLWGFGMYALLFLLGEQLGMLFDDSPDVYKLVGLYFAIAPSGYTAMAILRITQNTFNVFHKPFIAAALMIFQMLILLIPLAILGSKYIGFEGIIIAVPLSNIISGTAAYFWLKKILPQYEKDLIANQAK